MSLIVVSNKYIALAKELHVDVYDYSSHHILNIPVTSKQQDQIADIALAADSAYLALVTTSKELIIYELPSFERKRTFTIPRSVSRIRFTADNTKILVADKSGDVLLYDINDNLGNKILGHLSLLLDVLQSADSKFIISSDRDEKIRVACFPNTHNIQTYCLGHKEFVNHIEVLPHKQNHLISTSGDGTVKFWDYTDGNLFHTINTYSDVNNAQLRDNFIKMMDEGGIEVNNLPIVHCSIVKYNDSSSLLAITVHTYNAVLVYSVNTLDNKFNHKLECKLELERFPAAIQLYDNRLFVYDDSDNIVNIYKQLQSDGNENISFEFDSKIKVFDDVSLQSETKEAQFESIKVMYKRKFDNVQEYQERKKQRLEKSRK